MKLFGLISIGITSAMATTVVVVPSVVAANENKPVEYKKIKVIVDTDVGNDCDDIGALTILGNAYKKDLVDVKAVTVCNQYLPAFHATDIMLEAYGIDCPMGQADNPQTVHTDWGGDYSKAIDDIWEARSERDTTRINSATRILRKTLAENTGDKIRLITLGMLNNIANLIESPADDISNKTGRQLFEENVSEMVLMGGRFDNETYAEFNITEALASAKDVINTTHVPKIFSGWEIGSPVFTGKVFYAHPDSPQAVAYNTYNHGNLRESWDPLTMYVAINGAWDYSSLGNVTVQGEGYTIFRKSASGICRYIPIYPNAEGIANTLESWMDVADVPRPNGEK
ncbi:MAG: nucleoside hydrolase [Mycoplasmoidaceae bacterium]